MQATAGTAEQQLQAAATAATTTIAAATGSLQVEAPSSISLRTWFVAHRNAHNFPKALEQP